jgi:hypothetical protein
LRVLEANELSRIIRNDLLMIHNITLRDTHPCLKSNVSEQSLFFRKVSSCRDSQETQLQSIEFLPSYVQHFHIKLLKSLQVFKSS